MMLFKIVVANAGAEIEEVFHNFVENNEILCIQPDCEFNHFYDKWDLQVVPNNDEEKAEFFQFCQELCDHLEELGYEF